MDNARLQKIMKEKGYNTARLAELSGISVSTVNKIVYGIAKNPTLDNVQAIAKALGCTLDELVGEESKDSSYYLDSEAAEMAQAMFERPEMRVLFDASRKATKEDIETVAELLRKLSNK